MVSVRRFMKDSRRYLGNWSEDGASLSFRRINPVSHLRQESLKHIGRVVGAGSGDLKFMIIRTIGPLLSASSTRRPAMNSQRTKAAKARGVKLGNPVNLSNQLGGSAKGNAAMAARAAARAADLLPLILPMKAGGASLRQIADGLNRCGVPAPRGGDWSAVAVKRILDRRQV
jgi:hypothetical protein